MRTGLWTAGAALVLVTGAQGALAADLMRPAPTVVVVPTALVFQGEITGFVGYGVNNATDIDVETKSSFYYGGEAKLSIPLGSNFSTQFDVVGEANGGISKVGEIGVIGVGGHLSWRDPSRGLFGVFASYGRSQADTDDSANVGVAGIEGQFYLGNFTTYGQLGFANVDSSHDPLDSSSIFARGVGRYFVNPNFLLEGEVSYTRGKIHDSNLDALGWGLKAKFAVSSTLPVFVGVQYRGTNYNGHETDSATEHVGLISITALFGGRGTLFEQDRQGATLDTSTLPLRASAWASVLD